MKLHDKLMTIPADQRIAELEQLLERTQVSISWWGERLVSVPGYEGTVTINELAKNVLPGPHRSLSWSGGLVFEHDPRNENWSEKQSLDYDRLQARVKTLYERSDRELKKMCAYRILVPLSEFRPWCQHCTGDPRTNILYGDDH